MAILGASGFIGSHVRLALDADRLTATDAIHPGSDRDWLRALVTLAPSVVVNCAGRLSGSEAELEASNVTLVADLLEELRGRPIRLIQIGSAAEYGVGTPGQPTNEDAATRPIGSYGGSKLEATRLVLEAARAGDVSGAVLRFFNPIGAGVSAESLPGRATLQLRDALSTGRVPRMGSLGATRDFFDVRDAADAVRAACRSEASGLVINVGSGRGTTARELVRMLAEAAGYAGPIEEAEAGSIRSEQVAWQVADVSRAESLLGWRPRHSVRDAIDQLWASDGAGPASSSNSAPS